MKKLIIKKIRKFLIEIIKELLLEIIQNRIALLRRLYSDNNGRYDEFENMLMKAKMEALEEAHTILVSALEE